jgi:hypothetical protein
MLFVATCYVSLMLGLNNTTRRTTARGLIALIGGVWLLAAVAPCVMAAPHSGMKMPCAGTDHATLQATPNCDTLQAIDCQSGDITLTERDVVPDFKALPPRLLTVTPVSVHLPRSALRPDAQRFTLRLSPPPLYLQHNVFLI